jgi:hypothetical protein
MKKTIPNRPKFLTRKFHFIGEVQRELALACLHGVPIDADCPIEVIVRELVKVRSLDANAAYWAGPLRDIAEQAWVQGKQYSAEVWHEQFKREYLPDEPSEDLCKSHYRKWDYLPTGDRVLVASTTQLTVKGFALYIQSVEAFGASLGVQFSVRPE